MTIKTYQNRVDQWIKSHGVRYFDEKTNTLLLTEEVGEFARLIARKYGEQSFKRKEDAQMVDDSIKEEIADILFVLTCLANQMHINLEETIDQNFEKKTSRDHQRHHGNPKLKD
jgi:NTP pyrophosphatase (non-canonical NTP hydrolase)